MQKNVYEKKEECSGCGACKDICPLGCISMEYDAEGFCYPVIDYTRCIDCNQCRKICEHARMTQNSNMHCTYAMKNIDAEECLLSSSGALFPEVAKEILKDGGMVFGAAFDEDFMVRHIGIVDSRELYRLRGSKYVQSDVGDSYRVAEEKLKNGSKVLFSGTPCQIAGLYSFLEYEYENLITVAIMCHGVPSPLVWKTYLEQLRDGKKIKNVAFRHKSREKECWKKYVLRVEYEDDFIYECHSKDDAYYQAFSYSLSLRPSCYKCVYKKDGQLADIIIGDYWGGEELFEAFKDEQCGLSAVVVNTIKGQEIFEKMKDKFVVQKGDYEYLQHHNMINSCVKVNPGRGEFFTSYAKGYDIEKCVLNGFDVKRNFWEKHLQNFIEAGSQKECLVWGLGKCFCDNIDRLKAMYNIKFAFDNNELNWNKQIYADIRCLSLEQLMEKKDSVRVLILIENEDVCYEIGTQLEQFNINAFCSYKYWMEFTRN